MTIKKIAVVGSGFAGLATAWHLSKDYEVTLITSPHQKHSASTVSAGLLHPYVGPKAVNNWRGEEGVQSTLHLLNIASDALGKKVYNDDGFLRIAASSKQENFFRECADRNSDVRWLSVEECQKMVPGLVKNPGVFIESGVTVYPNLYIQGLKLALKNRGVLFRNDIIDSAKNIEGYDKTILCVGAGVFHLKGLPDLKLLPVKGQILQIPWPDNLPPLPYSLNSKVYMVMSIDQKSCFVGSTFERNFENERVDLNTACSYILPKLYALYPPLEGIQPTDCKTGIRVTAPGHLPLIQQIAPKTWIFTGLGSKGLLYHSLLSANMSLS